MIDVGQTIGNYRLTARLGEGGMGVVYLAEHPVIGKKVALKAIHPELSRNAEVVSRFVTEAKSVNQIGHEHIVDIADFGTTPSGEFYFIMEYLQGEAMADRLKREGRLDAQSLDGKAISEVATRARQSGVPCHAVVGRRALDSFGLRILDLQAVLEASSLRQISSAGKRLADAI